MPGARAGFVDRETSCDSSDQSSITKNIDLLARSGIRFTDFHVGAAVCTPSRAALQTGRLGARTGVTFNFEPGSQGGMPLNETTLAEYLKPAGYATCAIGKWHLGPQGKYAPTSRGYDAFLGIPESHDYGCTDTQMGAPDAGCLHYKNDRCPKNKHDNSSGWDRSTTCHPGPINPWRYSIPLIQGQAGLGQVIVEQPVDLDGTIPASNGLPLSHRYAEFAADFIQNSTADARPFLVYLAFSHMHVPIVHSPSYTGKSGKGVLSDALVELDDSVGMVLRALEVNGARQDTIVFMTGDNGPPEDQCDWGGSKGPFMGAWQKTGQRGGSAGKISSWEAGHREVGVVSWPGKIKSSVVSHVLASSLDYVPTILQLAGVELPTDRAFDGKNLGPVLFAENPAAIGPSGHHQQLFISWNGEAYPEWGSAARLLGPTGLFEKIRLPGLSAMFKVGYGAQCCRGVNGDANTPYNSTCSSHGGALAPSPAWLAVPLLFNLTVDVAESTPLEPGSDAHTAAWARVNESQAAMLASLRADKISTVLDRRVGEKLCCNPANVVCRCEEK